MVTKLTNERNNDVNAGTQVKPATEQEPAPGSSTCDTIINCPNDDYCRYTTNGKSYITRCNYDYYGGDIALGPTDSLADCASRCSTFAGCVAATWVGGMCYLKSSDYKIVYNSFETASADPNAAPNAFSLQQAAAYAAGAQGKAWNDILLFYNEQQSENTPYVTTAFLTGLARQIPGLNVNEWNTQRFNPKYTGEVVSDAAQARKLNLQGTPSLSFSGPKSQTQYTDGDISYAEAEQAIKQVS